MDLVYRSVNNVLNDDIQGRRLYLTLRSSYFNKIIACIYLKMHIISQFLELGIKLTTVQKSLFGPELPKL